MKRVLPIGYSENRREHPLTSLSPLFHLGMGFGSDKRGTKVVP